MSDIVNITEQDTCRIQRKNINIYIHTHKFTYKEIANFCSTHIKTNIRDLKLRTKIHAFKIHTHIYVAIWLRKLNIYITLLAFNIHIRAPNSQFKRFIDVVTQQ